MPETVICDDCGRGREPSPAERRVAELEAAIRRAIDLRIGHAAQDILERALKGNDLDS